MVIAEPAPELVDRFRRDLAAVGFDGAPIGIAVSGGPDSIALLLLAAAAFPGIVSAATVDHGLRPEAADEARFVARLCASLGIPHRILGADVDTGRASVQRAAREARYRSLQDWLAEAGIGCLATAHHADDQAETLLMRLLRGAGVGGLSGVRARTCVPVPGSDIVLVRPLLGWRRTELATIVAAAASERTSGDPASSM
jgi:tRNA(Ile)-lysidine synthase